MYNAAIISVFDIFEVGYVECKKIVSIPLTMRNCSKEKTFKTLISKQTTGFNRLLAVKFLNIHADFAEPFFRFKLLKSDYKIIEESDWYINAVYDTTKLEQIHRLADPSILLQNDKSRIKYWLDYYVDLRKRGYSDDEAINTIYG